MALGIGSVASPTLRVGAAAEVNASRDCVAPFTTATEPPCASDMVVPLAVIWLPAECV